MNIIKKLIFSSQHRQLYVLRIGIKILKIIIKFFNYKGDIMINNNSSFIGNDGVFLDTKGSARYLKSNKNSKVNQGYEIKVVLDKILDQVNFIFDVGANVGEISIYLSKFYPNAKIFAFEPSTKTIEMLKENIRNQFFDCKNISIFEKSISNFIGKTNLTISEGGGNTIILNPKLNRQIYTNNMRNLDQVENVEVTTLTKICEEYKIKNIDFLKIDIEGAEPTLTNDIIQLKPKIILTEISDKNTELNYQKMFDELKKYYQFYDKINYNIIPDIKFFIFDLFSRTNRNLYKVSISDVWLIRKDIDKSQNFKFCIDK